MKSLPSAIRDEIYRGNIFSVDLVEFALSVPYYLCSGPYDIQANTSTSTGQTFKAQGDFLQFGGITEDFDVKVGKLSINLSGLNEPMCAAFTNPNISAKRVSLYRVFLDLTTGQIVGTPQMLFNGQINNVSIVESARSVTMTVDAASLFADFERTNGRKTNNDSNWRFQGSKYDTSFEKAGILKNTDVLWGRTA